MSAAARRRDGEEEEEERKDGGLTGGWRAMGCKGDGGQGAVRGLEGKELEDKELEGKEVLLTDRISSMELQRRQTQSSAGSPGRGGT